MKKIILLLLVAIAISTNIKADIAVKDYKEFLTSIGEEETLKMVENYIVGVGKGFFWANAYLGATKQNPLYCQNSNLILNGNNYVEIMHREYTSIKYDDKTAMELILLLGLQKTFPCR